MSKGLKTDSTAQLTGSFGTCKSHAHKGNKVNFPLKNPWGSPRKRWWC